MNPILLQTHIWGTGSEWFWAFMQFLVVAASLYLTFMQFLAVVFTLVFIYLQVRVQTASHVVESLSTIHARWNSESMLRVRHHVCSRWIAGHRDFDGVAQYLAEFMEELGNYLRTHALTDRDLWEVQSWYIEHYYLMFKKGIEQYRQTYDDESLYSQFELLFKRMCKMDLKQHSPHFSESEQWLTAFAKAELSVADAVLKLKTSSHDVA